MKLDEETARKIQRRYYDYSVRFALAEVLYREMYGGIPLVGTKALYSKLRRAGFEWNGTYWTTEKVESSEPVEGREIMPFDDYRYRIEYMTPTGDWITRYFCCEDVAHRVARAHGVEVVALTQDNRTASPVSAFARERPSSDVDHLPANSDPMHE